MQFEATSCSASKPGCHPSILALLHVWHMQLQPKYAHPQAHQLPSLLPRTHLQALEPHALPNSRQQHHDQPLMVSKPGVKTQALGAKPRKQRLRTCRFSRLMLSPAPRQLMVSKAAAAHLQVLSADASYMLLQCSQLALAVANHPLLPRLGRLHTRMTDA